MKTIIATVEQIQGLFFVSDEDKNVVGLLESGDEINLDSIVFGDETNTYDDFIELSLDNGNTLQLKETQEQMFDETLSSKFFSDEQLSFSQEEIQEQLDAIENTEDDLTLNETPAPLDFLSYDNHFSQLNSNIDQDNFDLRVADTLVQTDFPLYLMEDTGGNINISDLNIDTDTNTIPEPEPEIVPEVIVPPPPDDSGGPLPDFGGGGPLPDFGGGGPLPDLGGGPPEPFI